MSRSTLRCALRAGALCLTATTTAAVVPAAADAAKVGVSAKRLNIQTGSRVTVKGGRHPSAPGTASAADPAAWPLGDPRPRPHQPRRAASSCATASAAALERARPRAPQHRRDPLARRLNVYRHALASWYGPGLFGNQLGCGGTLHAGSLGVANKSLPCGTKVTLRHHGRVLRVPVIDRGPYVGGREYDLTAATARKLGFSGHGPIQVTK